MFNEGQFMAIKIGDKIPQSSFQIMTADGPSIRTTADLFDNRTIVLVAVPGAFTPTCHNHHIPGYLDNLDALKDRGIDEIGIVSVNDVHVMSHWAKATGGDGKLTYLADGSGDFTKAIGLDVDLSTVGMGVRSMRYSMLVRDGIIEQLNIEENPGVADVSAAARILSQL